MNERIKDMLEQPVFDRLRDWYNIGPVQRATLEEFAELIVRECMNVGNALAKETFSYSTQPGDIFEYKAHAMEDVVEAINEHFGVKE